MRLSAVVALIHVERPVNFDLQRVVTQAWTPVVIRGEPSGIGRVDRDAEAAFGEEAAGGLEDLRGTGAAVTVAQDDVGAALSATRADAGRHRMAIEQKIAAEKRLGLVNELPQRLMVGSVKALDPSLRHHEAQLFRIYLLAAGDNPGDCAKTYADPRRAGVDEPRQRVAEHARIKFISFAIDIDVGARKTGRQERRTKARCSTEEFVDKAVLRSPQGQWVEPRGGEEISRIFGAAVRRSEDKRQAARYRLLKIENTGSGRSARELTVHAATLVRRRHAVTSATAVMMVGEFNHTSARGCGRLAVGGQHGRVGCSRGSPGRKLR